MGGRLSASAYLVGNTEASWFSEVSCAAPTWRLFPVWHQDSMLVALRLSDKTNERGLLGEQTKATQQEVV